MPLGNLRPIEIIAILLIVLLLFGAKRLPGLAKSVGQSLRIFKKETSAKEDAGSGQGEAGKTSRSTAASTSEDSDPEANS
jgi:sec-independent protein translocase protein TatA